MSSVSNNLFHGSNLLISNSNYSCTAINKLWPLKVPVAEAVNMSAVSSVRIGLEAEVETVNEMDDGMVEVGAVSEATKGSLLGFALDTSGSDYRAS